MQYLIGIDMGTQGTKASLYQEDGKAVCHAFEECRLLTGPNGEIEQDPEELYGSVIHTIRELLAKSPNAGESVAGIAIAAQMAGVMAIDEDWNAVTPYDSWLDTRCGEYIGLMKDTAENEIIRKTGGQVTYVHGPRILWWKHERPDVYRRAAKFIMPGVYAAGKLCGLRAEDAYIDYTHLHFTGFADNRGLCWDPGLLRSFDIEPDKMPRIAAPYERIGTITAEAAKLTGLKEGTLVAAGCGDSAASSFGAGVIRPGMIYDVAGTASIFSVSTCQFNPDEEHKTILAARSVVDRLYIPHAYLSGGGLCVRWMRQIADKSYDEMEEMASKAAGEISDLFFIPHFSGRTCPNEPNVRGGFTGLSWSHTAGHLYRAVLESIALEYNEYFGILKEREPDLRPDGIYGVGGGTKCDLFNQIKADVLGIPYHTLQIEEAGTYGLAVLAGYAAGLYPDLLESGRHIRIRGSYQPDARQFAGYQNKTGQYSRLLKNCRNGLDIE